MSLPRQRLIPLLLLSATGVASLVALSAIAAVGGPDSGDLVFTDSTESPGPPATALNLDELSATTLSLGDAGTQAVTLPFDFEWYGSPVSTATVVADGGLLFSGELSDVGCPGSGGAWSGVAAFGDDLAEGTVRTAVAGRYPYRAFAVEWVSPHAVAGGEGTVQAWLLEARSEAVIVLEDVTFGDPAVDGGGTAAVGAQGSGASGLAWSCTGGLSDGTAAWFGSQGGRPMAKDRTSSSLDRAWLGSSAFEYAGRSIGAGDMDGDGLAEVAIGTPDGATVSVLLGGSAATGGGSLADADVLITDPGTTGTGTTDSRLGAAIAVTDVDGDGLDDLAMGAPYAASTTVARVGGVVLMAGGTVGGDRPVEDSDTFLAGPPTNSAQAGSALAAGDVDGDGYPDLVVGAPKHDAAADDAGAVYLWLGGATALDADALLEDSARWDGTESLDYAGSAVGVADMDGDGDDDLLVGAPEADGASTNSGLVYVVLGGPGLVGGALSTEAGLIVQGDAENDRAGTAVIGGDIDGDGYGDLVVGAPYYDDPLTSAGGAFVFISPFASLTSSSLALADADVTVTGGINNANAGSALALGDINGDDFPDLAVGAPNMSSGATGGGVVGIFTDGSVSSMTMDDATFRLDGDSTGGQLGLALGLSGPTVDHDGDGRAELWVGAPYDPAGGADSAGAIYGLVLTPDFLDADGDGFVATSAGGIDCDDGDAAVFPGAGETAADLVDNDCDGWVDDLVVVRRRGADWVWDLGEELGTDAPVLYDFETSTAGSDVTDLYTAEGLTLSAGGTLEAQTSVYGSLARDSLAASFTPATSNHIDLAFSSLVDAAAFWMMDADGTYLVTTYDTAGTVLDSLPLGLSADGRAGGSFVGLTFSSEIDRLRIQGSGTTGWGLDDIELVWADQTDRDGDGWSDAEGDCDDSDAAVSPDGTEVLGNGIDDDCDGVIDGGDVTVYTDPATWEADAAILAETVDFETLAVGSAPTDDYLDLGVSLDGSLVVSTDIDGSAPRDTQAAQASGDTVVLSFTETQPAAALWLLDAEGTVTITGSLDGVDLYVADVSTAGGDLAGGVFVGLTWDLGVDTLTLTADASTLSWGLDDLSFSALGLDDADGDGRTERDGDCDDTDASVFPGASETWYDGVDSDCDGASDYDADRDGFDLGDLAADDCDDHDPSVSPDGVEIWYDGVDSDCDGASDYDADGDGHDDLSAGGDDCDDGDAAVSPDATEVWYDGVDSDCAGDDDYDADHDGWVPSGLGVSGTLGVGDCDDGDEGISPDAAEAWYDGVDSDCDGASDYDADGDGHDAEAYGGDDCEDTDPDAWPGATGDVCYDGVDTDCDGWSDDDCDRDGYDSDAAGGLDCDDTDDTINPDAVDVLGDGIDSNCDGAAEFDDDGDGYDGVEDGGTDCDDTDPDISPGATEVWYDGVDSDCAGDDDDDADGDGYPAESVGGDDCDDTDASVHPGAADYYYDGVDSDCDGLSDYDADGDGWSASWYGGADCDDGDATISPDATEVWYDGVDSDCDGASDDDADGDGWDSDDYGGLDCDDADDAISPAATEIPGDGVDQDCDGSDDVDGDGDGFGSAEDCDDGDSTVYPGADEIWYDGVDGDCDGGSDYDADADGADSDAYGGLDCDDSRADVGPDATDIWYDGVDSDCAGDDDYDADADGWPALAWGGTDCDDSDPARNPGVTFDDCGGGDEDCDGTDDEDCAGGDGGASDGGASDGGASDGGASDGGASDGGSTDGGASDGGTSDGGASDGGTSDGGSTDGGASDGGSTDGGASDGGTSDGGTSAGGDGWVSPNTDAPTDASGGCSGCAGAPASTPTGLAWLGMLGVLGLARRRKR